MRVLILVPLLAAPLGAMTPTQTQPATQKDCPVSTVMASEPDADKPMARKLADEPPAALVAAVDARHDGCPVMLVWEPGDSTLGSGWTPVPGGSVRSAE